MSKTVEKRMQRADMWEWFLNSRPEKYKHGRRKTDKADDKYNIRMRAIINGDRLIVGVWRGCNAEPVGVYYMTASMTTNITHDGKNWTSGRLEYIVVPQPHVWYYTTTYNYNFRFISGAKDAEAWIRANFELPKFCNYGVLDLISHIEYNTAAFRRRESSKRRSERLKKWLSDLPPLPDDIDNFVTDTVFGGLHYAFGEKDKITYFCTACKRKFRCKDWKHGKYYECPQCHAQVKVDKKKNIDNGDRIYAHDRVMLIQSYRNINGEICSIKREMFVNKIFDSKGEEIGIDDGSLTVLRLDGSTVRGRDIYYNNYGTWSDRNTYSFRHERCYCYPDVAALDGTAYDKRSIEAAALKGWRLHYNNMMQYCRNDPRMEYLVKGNFKRLVEEISVNGCLTSTLFPGETVQEVLGIDGQGVARLRQNNGGRIYLQWLRAAFMSYNLVKGKTGVTVARNMRIPEKAMEYFQQNRISPTDVAVPLNFGVSPEQIANYIEKQKKLMKCGAGYVAITWRDTLNMTDTLQLEGGSYTIFPKNLKARHAELVGIRDLARLKEECKHRAENLYSYLSGIGGEIKKIEAMYPSIAQTCKEIRDKFEWGNKDYLVIVPDNVQDIVVEGYLLGHCISKQKKDGTYLYFERMQERETYIMFLRKADKPESPWYTMEVEPDGAVRQLRTFGDDEGADRSEAKAFLAKWRREIAKRLGQAEREAAQVSREKRLAEFEELRRNGNIIRNGKLAGKLLVEVLEKDFEEFNEEAV